MKARIRVAYDLTAVHADKPRRARRERDDSASHLGGIRWLELEGDRPPLNGRCIDGRQRCAVRGGREANVSGHALAPCAAALSCVTTRSQSSPKRRPDTSVTTIVACPLSDT